MTPHLVLQQAGQELERLGGPQQVEVRVRLPHLRLQVPAEGRQLHSSEVEIAALGLQ